MSLFCLLFRLINLLFVLFYYTELQKPSTRAIRLCHFTALPAAIEALKKSRVEIKLWREESKECSVRRDGAACDHNAIFVCENIILLVGKA